MWRLFPTGDRGHHFVTGNNLVSHGGPSVRRNYVLRRNVHPRWKHLHGGASRPVIVNSNRVVVIMLAYHLRCVMFSGGKGELSAYVCSIVLVEHLLRMFLL